MEDTLVEIHSLEKIIYLGMFMNNNLKWNVHIDSIKIKCIIQKLKYLSDTNSPTATIS